MRVQSAATLKQPADKTWSNAWDRNALCKLILDHVTANGPTTRYGLGVKLKKFDEQIKEGLDLLKEASRIESFYRRGRNGLREFWCLPSDKPATIKFNGSANLKAMQAAAAKRYGVQQ
jgi:hypothetical protein